MGFEHRLDQVDHPLFPGVDINRGDHARNDRQVLFFTQRTVTGLDHDPNLVTAPFIGISIRGDIHHGSLQPAISHKIIGDDLCHSTLPHLYMTHIARVETRLDEQSLV
jgi:hypothetical protein